MIIMCTLWRHFDPSFTCKYCLDIANSTQNQIEKILPATFQFLRHEKKFINNLKNDKKKIAVFAQSTSFYY